MKNLQTDWNNPYLPSSSRINSMDFELTLTHSHRIENWIQAPQCKQRKTCNDRHTERPEYTNPQLWRPLEREILIDYIWERERENIYGTEKKRSQMGISIILTPLSESWRIWTSSFLLYDPATIPAFASMFSQFSNTLRLKFSRCQNSERSDGSVVGVWERRGQREWCKGCEFFALSIRPVSESSAPAMTVHY